MTLRATVVIPYFEDQRALDLALAGLDLQTLPADAFEVIVADDGSRTAPVVGAHPYATAVVRQDDLGVRPGAARNLGVRHASGDALVFLDGDMVPEPRYLEELLRVCDGRRLTVGRRRHADLDGLDVPALQHWLRTGEDAPPVLPEPEWLTRAYAESRDLADSDLRSYRYVIGAVLACPRRLFERLGGFAEEIDVYGGEDWELGRRWWLAGGDLAHAPEAVAWHDGPDLAGRPDADAVKDRETLRIAELLTDPHLRGRGLIWRSPRVVVRCAFARDVTDSVRLACAEGFLTAGDVGVWLGGSGPVPVPDPRLHSGQPGTDVLQRCELVIDVGAPVVADEALVDAWQRAAPARNDALAVRSPRDLALDRPCDVLPDPERVPEHVQLERWFGSRAARHDRG